MQISNVAFAAPPIPNYVRFRQLDVDDLAHYFVESKRPLAAEERAHIEALALAKPMR